MGVTWWAMFFCEFEFDRVEVTDNSSETVFPFQEVQLCTQQKPKKQFIAVQNKHLISLSECQFSRYDYWRNFKKLNLNLDNLDLERQALFPSSNCNGFKQFSLETWQKEKCRFRFFNV